MWSDHRFVELSMLMMAYLCLHCNLTMSAGQHNGGMRVSWGLRYTWGRLPWREAGLQGWHIARICCLLKRKAAVVLFRPCYSLHVGQLRIGHRAPVTVIPVGIAGGINRTVARQILLVRHRYQFGIKRARRAYEVPTTGLLLLCRPRCYDATPPSQPRFQVRTLLLSRVH